jgi:hypothetical protein
MADESKATLGWPGVVVVIIVAVVIAWITIKTIDKYSDSKDVAAVLAVVITPLAGVGAAAFGIKLSADAKAETKRVKKEARNIAAKANRLRGGAGLEVREKETGRDPLAEIEDDLRRLGE